MPEPAYESSSDMSQYAQELRKAMRWLGHQYSTLFLGQAVACPGTAMTGTLQDIDPQKLIEVPVFEDCQLGMSIGLALCGCIPVSIFPRWNFLLLATNQLVLHLDKLPLYSSYRPKVIIRTAVASREPLDPQIQHYGDFSAAFRLMLKNVEVIDLRHHAEIMPAYRKAYERCDGRSTLIVERTELYA